MESDFKRLITQEGLAKLAGPASFARGAGYFDAGAVSDLVQTRGAVLAIVTGNEDYRVVLRPAGRTLEWSCSCPLGDERTFCKHAVATGLAWLARGADSGDELARVRTHLDGQSKEALVELLIEQAANDPGLRAQVESASLRRDPPLILKTMKEEVGKAFAMRGFVSRQHLRALLARADAVAHMLHELRRRKRPRDAVELAHYAMRRGIAAYERSDDSGGGFGDALRGLAATHLEICRAAKPDPEAFGKDLFQLQMLDDWGFFKFEDYAPLLGKKGLARYRALAQVQWKKVPRLGPGAQRDYAAGHSVITGIMASLARYAGDVDATVSVASRDLTHPYCFLRVADLLSKAGRHDEALAWAERGQKAFARDPDPRLVDFLAEAYHREGRDRDAVALAWETFTLRPELKAYQRLEKTARRAKDWKSWREKALARIRADLKRPATGPGARRGDAGGHTLLVEIFLHEGDSTAALAEAKAGGCRQDIWMQLAAAREKTHPADAAEIYRRRIEPVIDRKNNRAYDEAAELARKIQALMRRAGQGKEFEEWIGALREKHGAKRNFMQRIEGLR